MWSEPETWSWNDVKQWWCEVTIEDVDMAMVWRFVKCCWCEVVIFMMIRKWCWKNIALHVRFFFWTSIFFYLGMAVESSSWHVHSRLPNLEIFGGLSAKVRWVQSLPGLRPQLSKRLSHHIVAAGNPDAPRPPEFCTELRQFSKHVNQKNVFKPITGQPCIVYSTD